MLLIEAVSSTAAMVDAVNGLAAGLAALGAFVLAHVVVESGKRMKAAATLRAVVLGLEFVIIAEHGDGARA